MLKINKGDKYGRLIIIEQIEKKGSHRIFLCKCECGNKVKVYLNDLRRGHTKSCGCLKIEKSKQNKIHGLSNTRIYNIWLNIKARCNNKNNPAYKYYGGRGITYDKKWEKFEGFYEDMKKGYEKHLTIDREYNDGNYNKENCSWKTMKEQNRNKRNNNVYKGKCMIKNCEDLGLNYNTIRSRLNVSGWSVEEALELKPRINGNIKRISK